MSILKNPGKALSDAVNHAGNAVATGAKNIYNDPKAGLTDLATRTAGAGLMAFASPMISSLSLLDPSGKGMGQSTLWGSDKAKNAAWGDPGGVNASRAQDTLNAQDAADVAAQQKQIQDNVTKTGAIYGLGASPEAQQNAARLGNVIGSQVSGAGGQAATTMSNELYSQLQQINDMFARSGMTGSGLEKQGINDAIAQYSANRGGLGANLANMRQSLYDTIRGQSQQAQQAVANGGNVTQDMALRDQINSINQAMSSNALSSALNGAAGATNQTANAVLTSAAASPQALQQALQGYTYNTNTGK